MVHLPRHLRAHQHLQHVYEDCVRWQAFEVLERASLRAVQVRQQVELLLERAARAPLCEPLQRELAVHRWEHCRVEER